MSTGGFSFTGFGNTGKTATTTPAFGTSTTPTFGSSTNSGFGSSTNSTFGSSTSSTFGSSTNSGFGSSTSSTFGSSTNSGFGSSTNSTFGSSQTTSPFGSGWNNQAKPGMAGMGQQQAAPNPISSLLQSYKYIFDCKNSEDDCVFSCVMFNFCPPDIRDEYLRDDRNRSLYAKYLKENPDPDNLVPVYVYGFDGLKTRIEEQKAVMKNVEKNLEILHNALIQIRVSTGECDRMARQCDSKQRILEEKMIRVLGKMESELSPIDSIAEIGLSSSISYELLLYCVFLHETTGLRSRLSAIYNALNTHGIRIPEEHLQMENAESILKFLENQEEALEKIVHILKQSQKELELIVNDPFVHVTYSHSSCVCYTNGQ
ncbi:hypothetical protein JH06_4586 [Blastocystis sp. subtype 4]|uniref:hypothetical protein n=1 Tax=Blastocystis sp. subtype 4 TaxID=944170 RepID=UPI0007122CBD|nr:hypothetical protein JH06_4586 [Blastocystis sp. subtype 4]KNB41889.1 hypothetical protein JH06_4586 [Blastocystis sp. subtype 4]|eukprot:XP_014525332.1 hypothetical protein JH06_4586 [Blastocystis sp. subtype 4]